MSTKRVYTYHEQTREFVRVDLAQESPLEPGVWLMPANSTAVEPPTFSAAQVCRWTGSEWTLERRFAPDRCARVARRDAARRLSEFTDAMVEACYTQEAALRSRLALLPDDVAVLDAFDPRASWSI